KLQRVMEMLSKGSISVDESRSPFGYAPIEDGNGKEPLIDLNKAPLSALKDYQRAKIKNDSPKGGDVNDE
ncbi:MAG: phage portal protein, partial [Enterococcus sp.]|nr:phage portal protein [Enterococcus sp.]